MRFKAYLKKLIKQTKNAFISTNKTDRIMPQHEILHETKTRNQMGIPHTVFGLWSWGFCPNWQEWLNLMCEGALSNKLLTKNQMDTAKMVQDAQNNGWIMLDSSLFAMTWQYRNMLRCWAQDGPSLEWREQYPRGYCSTCLVIPPWVCLGLDLGRAYKIGLLANQVESSWVLPIQI